MDTSEKEALVHCNVIQNKLRDLEVYLDKAVAARIIEQIPKSTLQTIQKAKKNDWLPLTYYVDITEQIAAEIGDEALYKLTFDSFSQTLDSSIVSPFFRSALNLAKIKPSTVLKISPLFWKSIYRNCGELSIVELGPTRVRLNFDNLPSYLTRNFLMGIAAAIHAIVSFSGVKALVIMEKHSKETRQASFIASWTSNLMKDK